MNVRTEQLDDQRDCRRIGDEIEQGLFSKYARAQIYMVILRPVEELRFVEERLSQTIACFDQPPDGFRFKSAGHDQKAVFVKRLSLLLSEANEIQRDSLSLR